MRKLEILVQVLIDFDAVSETRPTEEYYKVASEILSLCEPEWVGVHDELPPETGRYWVYVEEITETGKSHYQWNCSYSENDGFNTEYKNSCQEGYVTHWTYLLEAPK